MEILVRVIVPLGLHELLYQLVHTITSTVALQKSGNNCFKLRNQDSQHLSSFCSSAKRTEVLTIWLRSFKHFFPDKYA